MNDEIKEILDYITNLQEENQELRKRNDFLNSVCVGFDDKYEDYKSRIEKTIEYINQVYQRNEDGTDNVWILDFYEISNILNGDDKDD